MCLVMGLMQPRPWSGQMVVAAPSVGFKLSSGLSDCTEKQMYSSEDAPTFICHWYWAFCWLMRNAWHFWTLKREGCIMFTSMCYHQVCYLILSPVQTFVLRSPSYPHVNSPHTELSLLFSSTGKLHKLSSEPNIPSARPSLPSLSTAAFKSEPCVASSGRLDGGMT